jgi:hypothetical protein
MITSYYKIRFTFKGERKIIYMTSACGGGRGIFYAESQGHKKHVTGDLPERSRY